MTNRKDFSLSLQMHGMKCVNDN